MRSRKTGVVCLFKNKIQWPPQPWSDHLDPFPLEKEMLERVVTPPGAHKFTIPSKHFSLQFLTSFIYLLFICRIYMPPFCLHQAHKVAYKPNKVGYVTYSILHFYSCYPFYWCILGMVGYATSCASLELCFSFLFCTKAAKSNS